MVSSPASRDILKQFWGFDEFRQNQAEAIQAVIGGEDVLVIMPTGGGKSICYQVPALMSDGICIVVSPLIALMKDQVDQLVKKGIRADMIYSGLTRHEIDIGLDNAAYGTTKFLYVSPERLETDIFKERIKKMNISLVAIDEAHCISQWGYDFRPSYLNIAQLKDQLPDVPFMALTASATPEVQEDIVEQLQLKARVFKSSFKRDNISYVCRKVENKSAKLMEVLSQLGGSGIVYVRSRKKAEKVAEYLLQNDFNAAFYHAGLDAGQREERQEKWMTGATSIIVCTNAFGMGIDKSAVRFVIHWDVPDSLEAYYQEAGRAGRDGKMSYAVLLYQPADLGRLQGDIKKHFPEIKEIRKIYNALSNYCQVALHSGYMMSFDFDLLQFAKSYKLEMMKTWHVLRILEKEGYLIMSDSVKMPSRLKFTINKSDLYRFQVENLKWDKLIQVLLRTYGGIIDHYTSVNEQYIADRLEASKDDVIRQLNTLKRKGVINYIPYKQNPTITYLKNRLKDRSLIINRDFWLLRRSVAEKKVAAIQEYCLSDTRCRQQLISAYFGENEVEQCGKCDYCVEQRSSNFSEDEFSKIKSYLLEQLKKTPMMDIEVIENGLGYYNKKHYTHAIRRLVEEGILVINSKKEISLK